MKERIRRGCSFPYSEENERYSKADVRTGPCGGGRRKNGLGVNGVNSMCMLSELPWTTPDLRRKPGGNLESVNT